MAHERFDRFRPAWYRKPRWDFLLETDLVEVWYPARCAAPLDQQRNLLDSITDGAKRAEVERVLSGDVRVTTMRWYATGRSGSYESDDGMGMRSHEARGAHLGSAHGIAPHGRSGSLSVPLDDCALEAVCPFWALAHWMVGRPVPGDHLSGSLAFLAGPYDYADVVVADHNEDGHWDALDRAVWFAHARREWEYALSVGGRMDRVEQAAMAERDRARGLLRVLTQSADRGYQGDAWMAGRDLGVCRVYGKNWARWEREWLECDPLADPAFARAVGEAVEPADTVAETSERVRAAIEALHPEWEARRWASPETTPAPMGALADALAASRKGE